MKRIKAWAVVDGLGVLIWGDGPWIYSTRKQAIKELKDIRDCFPEWRVVPVVIEIEEEK